MPCGVRSNSTHARVACQGGHLLETADGVNDMACAAVDIYYPRRDRREKAPRAVGDIDIGLSQDLVDRFVRTGAQFVFVGPNTPLTGPRGIVQSLPRHDNHLHVRLPPGRP